MSTLPSKPLPWHTPKFTSMLAPLLPPPVSFIPHNLSLVICIEFLFFFFFFAFLHNVEDGEARVSPGEYNEIVCVCVRVCVYIYAACD